ncbi:ATP-binding protein [Hymenobacter sp. B1770]
MFITKQIVEMHQGTIWLESKENEGTTFFIELA